MIIRAIAPQYIIDENPGIRRVQEGKFTPEQIENLNVQGYNIYYLPNYPSLYDGGTVDGASVDTFEWVFVDMDLKDGTYTSKNVFIEILNDFSLPPTKIVDSGNGIHAYWRVTDLDAISYLKLQRRLLRYFKTDEAVGQIYQLMRLPGTINTKNEEDLKLCQVLFSANAEYTCENLSKALPQITYEDEQYCKDHYDRTYSLEDPLTQVKDEIPLKFATLLRESPEVKDIWLGKSDDRSKDDYRLGHVMYASGFNRQEATQVLVNTAKALARAPKHRLSYATNIVDKIWMFEDKVVAVESLSESVLDILRRRKEDNLDDKKFPCWKYLDNTAHGFRLGHVIGLVAGSGVGKTSVALNMFLGFVTNNPDYDHFFVPLEQPANEIAQRWANMCQEKPDMLSKVRLISNYKEDGSFRHLSLEEIKMDILNHQQKTGRKVGCVVIDHIGALKKKGKNGENQDLMDICHAMKSFAIETNTLLVMQSQAPREKAGIGDLELNKDAAYGTMYFEAYCDFLVTIWQPLKRCYKDGAPTVTAFKFCKIRHKKQGTDAIMEDVCYKVIYDPVTEKLRELTKNEEDSFTFFLSQATNKRKQDRKTDLVEYVSARK